MVSVDDIWLVDFGDPYPGEPASYRPAAIIGPADSFGPNFPFVFVVPLTTTRRGLSIHVEIEPNTSNGLDETSYAQCELVRSINRRRLVHRLGELTSHTHDQIATVVKTLLDY